LSRLSELLRQAHKADPQLGADLEAEISALTNRRTFGLVFEQHQPEAVELPGRPVQRGDKVRVLPPRGEAKSGERGLWRVERIARTGGQRFGHLVQLDATEPDTKTVPVDDLVVVAEFRDRIYPGLVETGRVELAGDKPFHTVINAENYHALEMLTYTHRHSIDAIYIDPPYNTGAKDWKYNNDYVEGDDDYRHSKWLAMMERRLTIARELLNPDDSFLIAAIDEKEVHRLGLLLEQTFPGCHIQTVTSVTNPAGSLRTGQFTRVEEYLFFVFIGSASVSKWATSMLDGLESSASSPDSKMPPVWFTAIRQGGGAALRANRTTPVLFYPVLLNTSDGSLHSVGDPLPASRKTSEYVPPAGTVPIWPLHTDGTEQTWRFSGEEMRRKFEAGTARLGRIDPKTGNRPVTYLRPGTVKKIERGEFQIDKRAEDGSLVLRLADGRRASSVPPAAVWRMRSHFARVYGTGLLKSLLPGLEFPFPKSLYSVEDALRVAVGSKTEAVVLDFFAGSGTTAHAVMRLNRQDDGHRQCISVTNNEASAEEQTRLRKQDLRPGDPDWEALGICDYITKPRITAAITGKTPEGDPIKGNYKFTDEFPMAEGFEENAAFFTLTYEPPLSVRHNRAFERIAPTLWMRAGSRGRIIDDLGEEGWDVAETYGVLENLDQADQFVVAIAKEEGVRTAFIVTDDESAFQMVCRELPSRVVPSRLYESYLQNFQINSGRSL
jgi:adenine-specific DNA-methyltransferase